MTAQIIFPKVPTYWILSDGVSYFDGYTSPNCLTTIGTGTQVYWIGSNHAEYVQACLDIGLTPRNTGDSALISINPDTPVLGLEDKIKNLQSRLEDMPKQINTSNMEDINNRIDLLELSIPGVRISAGQARLWFINNNITIDDINKTINDIESSPDTDSSIKDYIRVQWEYNISINKTDVWFICLMTKLNMVNDIDRAFTEAKDL